MFVSQEVDLCGPVFPGVEFLESIVELRVGPRFGFYHANCARGDPAGITKRGQGRGGEACFVGWVQKHKPVGFCRADGFKAVSLQNVRCGPFAERVQILSAERKSHAALVHEGDMGAAAAQRLEAECSGAAEPVEDPCAGYDR